jgi:hypothetical protein
MMGVAGATLGHARVTLFRPMLTLSLTQPQSCRALNIWSIEHGNALILSFNAPLKGEISDEHTTTSSPATLGIRFGPRFVKAAPLWLL